MVEQLQRWSRGILLAWDPSSTLNRGFGGCDLAVSLPHVFLRLFHQRVSENLEACPLEIAEGNTKYLRK